ncbi:MAG TPA: methionyl-tRNA formyltransferase [Dehalococcoidia bacterium]|nr:methionyl-tRNA formyltransferase [Dehalococcoidia bacterium]
MRIVLIGQQAFGESVLTRLREAGHDVAGVCAPATKEGARPDPLRAAAEAAGLPVLETRRLRRPEVFEQYAALKPDLNVMAFVTDIIRENVLTLPAQGTIQYHPSLLPRHRGISSINWAIIQGDAVTGLTVFWVDAGIDTGPILLQKEVPVGPDDTVGSIYFNKLFPIGVDAMVEAIDLVKAGTAPKIVQDESKATYEPPCSEEHTRIDWQAPADTTYNLIRGSNPQPGAVTSLGGARLKLFDVERVPGAGGAPGSVLAVEDAGVLVAMREGAVRLKRVTPEGQGKIAAADWARATGLAPGARLGG